MISGYLPAASSASRQASPNRLTASTLRVIARPGASAAQGASRSRPRPSASMVPPFGRGRLGAQAQEAKRADVEQRVPQLQRAEHDERARGVGQHVTPQDAAGPAAHDPRRLDIWLRPHGQHRGAHQAGEARRAGQAHRHRRAEQPRAQHRHNRQGQEQAGKGEQNVDDPHQEAVRPAAGVAVQHAQQVGAQRMGQAGGQQLVGRRGGQGINRSDVQQVGHQRIGGAAPPLAKNLLRPCKAHQVPHLQEIVNQSLVGDDAQLPVESGFVVSRCRPPDALVL